MVSLAEGSERIHGSDGVLGLRVKDPGTELLFGLVRHGAGDQYMACRRCIQREYAVILEEYSGFFRRLLRQGECFGGVEGWCLFGSVGMLKEPEAVFETEDGTNAFIYDLFIYHFII